MAAVTSYSRLPDYIRPKHYKLRLEPNFDDFTFKGDISVVIEVEKDDISEIAINVNKLDIHDVSVKRNKVFVTDDSDDEKDGQSRPKKAKNTSEEEIEDSWSVVHSESEDVVISSYEVLEKEEVLLINLVEKLVQCTQYVISIVYTGVLDDSMRGFYRTSHNVHGTKKWGAACHFEATGARKCFPCFDQPEFRSVFDISLVRPEPGMEVLSNMSVKNITGDIVTFAPTPPLPSYLVCVVIGWYSSLSERSMSGIPVSVFTPQSETSHGEFALDVALKSVEYFKDFFSTPYTLPKLDLVAVPDFYIGAMENWGLLLFRETALLFDPKVGTTSSKQYVSILVTHEIAHQWFGNLVGIQWWDQLWLKEGFASWISFLAVDKIFPQFDIWSQFLTSEKMLALHLDSKSSSHPIEVPDGVNSPAQIDEIFDDISYSKGASIINMLYHWIGQDKFCAGLQKYLQQHQGTSASNDKLWTAMEEESSNSIAKVMNGWIKNQGYPVVTVELKNHSVIFLKQEPFGCSPQNVWSIPLRIEFAINGGPRNVLNILLSSVEDEINFGNCGSGESLDYILVNAGQTTFCRVGYSKVLLSKLIDRRKCLEVRDRVGLLSDSQALFTSNRLGLDDFMEVLQCFSGDTDYPVIQQLCQVADSLEILYEARDKWSTYLQLFYQILSPSLDKLGYEPCVEDTEDVRLARSDLIARLGKLGHSDTVGKCWMLWHHDQGGHEVNMDQDIRRSVFSTVARTCRWEVTEMMIQMYNKTTSAEVRRMLRCLASNTNVEIAEKILQWLLTDEVKHQDKTFILAGVASTGWAGRQLAWNFFVENSPYFLNLYTTGRLLINLITAATGQGYANTSEEADKFEHWFEANQIEGVERTVQQILEETRKAASLRSSTSL